MIDENTTMAVQGVQGQRRAFLQTGLALCLSNALPAFGQNQLPKMKVGFIARYQPYSFVQPDGRLTGFDVEVVQALLAASGFELETVSDSLQRLRQKLQSGEIAFIGNQLLMTPGSGFAPGRLKP
jgi:ABC-type amino acid transport substrate-binding protein